ncbi:MAG: TIGR04219 family outer membrane beta-barrel protein [Gammaproteobacteria bacterium]|nr:TIGR04219 family outer membrane beta-barrel protein [Gammaproteobacteria bacterium]MDH5629789.1 TIGR04219 family outer membrane beta-barrel protein [Gammaproteobacteria bacterium]
MKKHISKILLAGIIAAPAAQADVIGFEVGGYTWNPEYTGSFTTNGGGIAGTAIDVQNDLGYKDDDHNITWLSLEHPAPAIPNFKVVISDLATSGTSTLGVPLNFAGQTYTTGETVSSTFDMSNTEYTIYYELLDNWVNFDFGITFRQYDGEVALATDPAGSNINASYALDFMVPLLYAKARFDLPFSGFFADAEINTLSVATDMSYSLGYESDFGFGAKLGYRTFTLELEEKPFFSDLEFKGSYVSVFYHF